MKTIELPLSPDQEMLHSTSARFAETEWPVESVRAGVGEDRAEELESYTRQAAELGWSALLVPEEFGGTAVSGSGLSDAVVVAIERGRTWQPGPFISTNVVADALTRGVCGDELRKVALEFTDGNSLACWTLTDPMVDAMPGLGVRWEPDGDGYVLNGVARIVEHAELASWVLVAANNERGELHFLLPLSTTGVTLTPLESIDVTRRYQRMSFDKVRISGSALVGEPENGLGLAERGLQVAAVLSVADMVGAMTADFAMAVEYAKNRIAFGRPIGSFQSIKHLLAETSLLVEESKAILSAAVRADGTNDASKLASIAKAFVSDSAIDVGQNCFQVFGGIAFTWEHNHHLFMRRMTMEAALYGDSTWHRERLCTLYGLGGDGLDGGVS